jgi:hypothetical protein
MNRDTVKTAYWYLPGSKARTLLVVEACRIGTGVCVRSDSLARSHGALLGTATASESNILSQLAYP